MAKKNLKFLNNKTQKTWMKAKKIIPGGNMLLSKRLKCFYRINGQLTIKKQKVVML